MFYSLSIGPQAPLEQESKTVSSVGRLILGPRQWTEHKAYLKCEQVQ